MMARSWYVVIMGEKICMGTTLDCQRLALGFRFLGRRRSLAAAMMALVLGGCAVSGGLDQSKDTQPVVSRAELPSLPAIVEPADEVASSGKFQHSETEAVKVVAKTDGPEEIEANKVAYAAATQVEQPAITTTHADLKPFVGRWTLNKPPKVKAAGTIGTTAAPSDACVLVLEAAEEGATGHKAKGNSSCPTGLFMLDSWAAFEGRLVLKDHMGDEIVQLRSGEAGIWVGVSRDGTTYVFEKS